MQITLEQRRIAFISLLAVAAVAFLVALLVTILAVPNAGTWLIVAVVVLVLALGGELFLLVYGESKGFDEKGEWYAWESEAKRTQEVLLRCASCKQTFSIQDSGERPLRHACPHCGVTGVLREPAPGGGARPAPGR